MLFGSFRAGTFGVASDRAGPAHAAAADRVREWTRTRFALPEDATVMVAEFTCTVPGCPPLETVVAFWTGGDQRHHFKVFKPLEEVVEDDLPPRWLKNALADAEGGCECC
jgi:nitrate reductase delta subunit